MTQKLRTRWREILFTVEFGSFSLYAPVRLQAEEGKKKGVGGLEEEVSSLPHLLLNEVSMATLQNQKQTVPECERSPARLLVLQVSFSKSLPVYVSTETTAALLHQ